MMLKNERETTATGASVTDSQTGNGADTPTTGQDVNDRAAAMWAALVANPGLSTIKAGSAIGVSRITAGKILTRLEADGRATRTPGGYSERGRTPDTWHPVTDACTITPETVETGQAETFVAIGNVGDMATDTDTPTEPGEINDVPHPDPSPSGSVPAQVDGDGVPGDPVADERGIDGDAETAVDEEDVEPSDDLSCEKALIQPGIVCDAATDPEPLTHSTGGHSAAFGNDSSEEAPTISDRATPGNPGTSDDSAADDGDAGSSTRDARSADVEEPLADDRESSAQPSGDQCTSDSTGAESAPVDPAWIAARKELLDFAELVRGTVTATEAGDIAGALGRLELLSATVSQVRRNVRAVLTGTKRPTSTGDTGAAPARPGALRDRVLEHLTAHPGKDFTPYEIGRVLGNSSGAVSNALDRLVSLGDAEMTCERPRRFAATNPAEPINAVPLAAVAVA